MRAHLSDGLLHLVEVRGFVEVARHQLCEERGQHVGKREQYQAPYRLYAPTPLPISGGNVFL